MNEDNTSNPQQASLEQASLEVQPDLERNEFEQTDLEQTEFEQTNLEQPWAALLSETAQCAPLDSTVVPVVLQALRSERAHAADGSEWARYLSSAVQLQDADFEAVRPTLQALKLERRRVRQWRESVTRLIATTAAVAAVVAAVAVFSPPLSADPTDAYSAYQEAARGW